MGVFFELPVCSLEKSKNEILTITKENSIRESVVSITYCIHSCTILFVLLFESDEMIYGVSRLLHCCVMYYKQSIRV